MILDERLARGEVIVMDGATGTEIARRGVPMDGAAWCAVATLSDPDVVRGVHEDYISAGADLVIANTFATCRHVLEGAGLGERTVEINRRAVELAQQARDRASGGRAVAVAGSISNTMAWQPGTISPDPRFAPAPGQEAANYREVAETFAAAGADLIVLEMMLDTEHAARAVEAACGVGLPVWIGISATHHGDGHLTGWDMATEERGNLAADHTVPQAPPLGAIVDRLTGIGGQVCGIMHSSVATTGPSLDVVFSRWPGPVMAYPETLIFDTRTHMPRVSVTPGDFAAACRGWAERGVQILGGCCGTTVEHIAAMAAELPRQAGPRPA